MKIKIVLLYFCLSFITLNLKAQSAEKGSKNWTGVDMGLGGGLDYGGFGGRLTVMPHRNFGFFGSGGFALAGFGYNVGVNIAFKSERKSIPYLTGMYGYNAAIKVTGALEFEKLYYGPSFGLGWKILIGRSNNFLNLEALIPIRDPAFRVKVDELKRMGAKFNFVPPFAISFGFHFGPPKVTE